MKCRFRGVGCNDADRNGLLPVSPAKACNVYVRESGSASISKRHVKIEFGDAIYKCAQIPESESACSNRSPVDRPLRRNPKGSKGSWIQPVDRAFRAGHR